MVIHVGTKSKKKISLLTHVHARADVAKRTISRNYKVVPKTFTNKVWSYLVSLYLSLHDIYIKKETHMWYDCQ